MESQKPENLKRISLADCPALKAIITITCVDNVQARFSVAEILKEMDYRKITEMTLNVDDFGNSQDTGQVILSTIGDKTAWIQREISNGGKPAILLRMNLANC